MASTRKGSDKPRRRAPATTPEARENQLIDLAVDLAEVQIREGSASAQVISHFLKLGSTRERLEQERLEQENLLVRAKIENLDSMKNMEELYSNAINAMRGYRGEDEDEEYYDE